MNRIFKSYVLFIIFICCQKYGLGVPIDKKDVSEISRMVTNELKGAKWLQA
jgi:hypothetical protein